MFVIATLGCNVDGLDFENVEGPTVNTSPAIPVGYAHYTIRELIEEISDTGLDLQEDSTTLLYMIYRDSAEFTETLSIIDIQDVSNSARIDLPPTPASGISQIIPIDTTFIFGYAAENGESLDTVYYSSGNLGLSVTSGTTNSFTYTAIIINTIDASSSSATFSTSQPDNIGLNGYKTYFDHSDTLTNIFRVQFLINISLDPGESIGNGEFLEFDLDYSGQEFSLFYGQFGRDDVEFEDQVIDLQFFENLGSSGLEFGNPILSFEFENSFGLPLGIDFSGLYSLKGNDTTDLTGDITELENAYISASQSPGNSEITTIQISRANSNFADLLNTSPQELGFRIKARTNPLPLDTVSLNFVKDDSRIDAQIEMTLPMEVRLNDLTRRIHFNLQGGLNFDEADSVTIRVVTVNEIPLYVLMDMEILDETDSVLYSVANNAIISTPFLNIDGSLKEARKTVEDISISKEGIEALNTGTKIRMTILLNSPKSRTGNDIFVKILADYQIDIQVGIVGTLIIDL